MRELRIIYSSDDGPSWENMVRAEDSLPIYLLQRSGERCLKDLFAQVIFAQVAIQQQQKDDT
jgi:hypothetical protein